MDEASPVLKVLEAIRSGQAGGIALPTRICIASAAAMPIDGAAVSLITRGVYQENVGASNPTGTLLAELESTVGEGPGITAFTIGGPVLVPDLAHRDSRRWPAYTEGARAAGVRAVFAFPLQLGAVRLGVLTLHNNNPGTLADNSLSDALRVADLIVLLLLGKKGELAADLDELWLDPTSHTRNVHQATGMLLAQLGVSAEEAFARLRAYAFVNNLRLSQVAQSVVARELRIGGEELDPI